MDDKSEESD